MRATFRPPLMTEKGTSSASQKLNIVKRPNSIEKRPTIGAIFPSSFTHAGAFHAATKIRTNRIVRIDMNPEPPATNNLNMIIDLIG